MTYKRFSPNADTFLVIRFKPVFGKTEFFNSYGCYQQLSLKSSGQAPFGLFRSTRYSNFAYSVFASFRMGMSGSTSFQRVRKSLWAPPSRLGFLQENNVRIPVATQNSEILSVLRQTE